MSKKYNPKELILVYTVTIFNSKKYTLYYNDSNSLKITRLSAILIE